MYKRQLLVADEPTSALDSETEAGVLRALASSTVDGEPLASSASDTSSGDGRKRNNSARRTSVYVAHRLSTIAGVDAIFVLERGVVVERGTHEELLRDEGGVYSRMWRAQQQRRQQQTGRSLASEGEEEGEEEEEDGLAAAAALAAAVKER